MAGGWDKEAQAIRRRRQVAVVGWASQPPRGVELLVALPCYRATVTCRYRVTGRDIHWSIDDPASMVGSADLRHRAYRNARDELRQRIGLFLLANRLVASEAVRGSGAR